MDKYYDEGNEAQRDPSVEQRHSIEKQTPYTIPSGEDTRSGQAIELHETGEHSSIRSTSTDADGLPAIKVVGKEESSQTIADREPEDRLPDQLDRNK